MSGNSHTCITCRVLYADLDLQRKHYKSDWHRYNLKRKVADLPPITAVEFNEKVIEQRNASAQINTDTLIHCKHCTKTFTNENTFNNHIKSKKHEANAARTTIKHAETLEIEEIDSDEWDEDTTEVNSVDCLFCGHHSRTTEKNLRHMTVKHTFFIADVEFCTDIPGLVEYLGEKINVDFTCVWCNVTFTSVSSVRSHIADKGHSKMLHEGATLAEYAEFYDYSASYPDGDVEDDGDLEDTGDVLDDCGYELVLPSGRVLGHRSLARYYRQSLPPERAVTRHKSEKLHRVLAHYRSVGYQSSQAEVVARKAKDLQFMKRAQAKWNMALSVKANKLQPHFRRQVNF